MAINRARFRINGTNSSPDQGYSATNSQALTCTLEQVPSDALSVKFDLYDPLDPASPLASKDAPAVAWVANGLPAITLPTIAGNAVVNMPAIVALPASSIHSYMIRCTVSTATGPEVFERLVAIYSTITTPPIRKPIPGESIQFSQRSWADSIADLIDAMAGSVTGVTSFEGRAGAVSSAYGDYIASDIPFNNAGTSLISTQVQAALAELSVLTTGATATYIFKPGAATVHPVYGDFNQLWDKIILTKGPQTISVEVGPTNPATIPIRTGGGAYDFEHRISLVGSDKANLTGAPAAIYVHLARFANGATIANLAYMRRIRLETLTPAGGAPLLTVDVSVSLQARFDECWFEPAITTAPLFRVPATSLCRILMTGFSSFGNAGIAALSPVVDIVNTGYLLLTFLDGAQLSENSLTGGGAASVVTVYVDGSRSWYTPASALPAQAGLDGATTKTLVHLDQAQGVGFSASTPGNWLGGSAPEQVGPALDELATRRIAAKWIQTVVVTAGVTITSHADAKLWEVEIQAAGGGSGGTDAGANQTSIGGSSGAGTYATKRFTVAGSTAYSCSIGAAGTGGAAGLNQGTDAASTTLTVGGVTVTVPGGLKGVASRAASASPGFVAQCNPSAVPTNADTYILGDPNQPGICLSLSHARSGSGGSSRLGPGANGVGAGGSGGSALSPSATAYGAGASGACQVGAGSDRAGADGGAAVIIVHEFGY